MNNQKTISKPLALLLALLLLVSIMPRAYFHDLFADHKDWVDCSRKVTDAPCIHQQPINCHFSDLVVTTPFEVVHFTTSLRPPVAQVVKDVVRSQEALSLLMIEKDSRGPPAL